MNQIQFSTFIVERVNETDAVEPIICQPWSSRASKMTQPNLDFMGKNKGLDYKVGVSIKEFFSVRSQLPTHVISISFSFYCVSEHHYVRQTN